MPQKTSNKSKNETKYKMPKYYKVLMYNDDFTPMELVVEILETIFHKGYQEAISLMLGIHRGSYAVVGTYPRDIAQTKATKAESIARQAGYPLKVEAIED
ncbi:MAG: ATP-dependent Clp protease adaptor ClpS [Lachnospiraceae bacterium]